MESCVFPALGSILMREKGPKQLKKVLGNVSMVRGTMGTQSRASPKARRLERASWPWEIEPVLTSAGCCSGRLGYREFPAEGAM